MSDLRQQLIKRKNELDMALGYALNKFHADTGLRVETVELIEKRDANTITYHTIARVKI